MKQSMRIYIERNGRPYNYLDSVKKLNERRNQHLLQEERDWIANKENEEKVKEQKKQKEIDHLESLAADRLKDIE